MFAGPNGSGKSTVKAQVNKSLWGQFINADNIEADLRSQGFFDLRDWDIEFSTDEIRNFFLNSWVGARLPNWNEDVASLTFQQKRIEAVDSKINSYMAAVIGEFLRIKLIEQQASFTFETVMSDRSKVQFLQDAKSQGYRTYLYYVATRDPQINVNRVTNRVDRGGHGVPNDKIISRYGRSLDLLLEAIMCCDRAYLWDNSEDSAECFAEFEGDRLIIRSSPQPAWFHTYVLDKIKS
jgi:predicted ABC-type ATPase